MIDKIVTYASVIGLLVCYAYCAPTSADANASSQIDDSRSSVSPNTSSRNSNLEPVFDSNRTATNVTSDKGQLLAAPSPDSKGTSFKARKNKNDLFFCCTEDDSGHLDEPVSRASSTKRNKDRERNMKPPILKRGKDLEVEEPTFERRPALLLRFFPDGTAVLISKFQLHLHVKPKQIKFEPDDGEREVDDSDFNPSLILNDGKSYEVSYKRLEAVPSSSSREQSAFDLDESEERESSYREDIDHRDHEFVTTSVPSTKSLMDDGKPSPLQETTTQITATKAEINKLDEISKCNKSEKAVSPTVVDSPFFVMTSDEMSSLQQQYDPAVASPLKSTTSLEKNDSKSDLETTTTLVPPTTVTSNQAALVTTESSNAHMATFTPTTTIKCLSFKNQLSLALSTEDNIDNSLLKRHIFPTEDCDNSAAEISNSLSKLQDSDTTAKSRPVTLPIITRTPLEPTTTTPSYSRHNLVPYLASQFSDHPSNPDLVVVTSLPVLIDLKSTARKESVTDIPAWREVTVGVVRDQQGQPLKPRYNNWMAHLRGLRKKSDNKFWNDFTTPKPSFQQQSIQNFHQSPSQVNPSFWTDLQRQGQMSKDRTDLYRANPPRNYGTAQKENDYQFWRSRTPDGRWNHPNGNSKVPEYSKVNESGRNHQHRNFENTESRQNPRWSSGSLQQNNRRW